MNTQNNTAIVKRVYECFRCGDIQGVLALMSEDVLWTTPGQRALIPFSGQFKGRHAVEKCFEALAASEVSLVFEPSEIVADGDSVVAFVHYWAHARATGITCEGEGVHYFQFRNGKVAGFREFFDPALMNSSVPHFEPKPQPDPVHCKLCC